MPGYRGRLNDHCVTIAEVLRAGGLFHRHERQVARRAESWRRSLGARIRSQPQLPRRAASITPTDHGPSFSSTAGKLANDDPALPPNWYTTDLWTDYGIKFIDEARAAKKPFFLYLAYNAPHFPLAGARRTKSPSSAASTRSAGTSFASGVTPSRSSWASSTRPGRSSPRPQEVQAWDDVSPAEQDRFDHIMAIYAAVVAHMDTAVGRLVDSLQQRGVLDNTLILFLSDNGANAESGPNGRLEGESAGLGRIDGLRGAVLGHALQHAAAPL